MNPEKNSSPEVLVNINGEEMALTYHNTDLYIFSDQYKAFNHVYYHEGGRTLFLFNNEFVEDLEASGFPAHYAFTPSNYDINAYIGWSAMDLDGEIDGLLGNSG